MAVQMQGKSEVGRRGVPLKAIFQEETIGAQVDKLLALDQAGYDSWHILVEQRFAPGDRYDRRTAFLDRFETFLRAKAPVEDRLRIADLPAPGTGEITAKEGL
jgi:hypothetical protein